MLILKSKIDQIGEIKMIPNDLWQIYIVELPTFLNSEQEDVMGIVIQLLSCLVSISLIVLFHFSVNIFEGIKIYS